MQGPPGCFINRSPRTASLRFGEDCRKLGFTVEAAETKKDRSNAKKGSDLIQAVAALDQRIAELQKEIKSKERWEWVEKKRQDVVDEMDNVLTRVNYDEEMELGGKGAVEMKADDGTGTMRNIEHTVWGQVIVGAEVENALLEKLVNQRRLIAGD